MLSDYINDLYFPNTFELSNKENIMVYNPAIGYTFTSKLIKKFPEISFIPLQNKTNIEMINMLLRAKVYIGFGNHPGKDRIPREVAF